MRQSILFRYLVRHLVTMLLGVLLVLAALECVIGVIGELSDLGHGHYTFSVAFLVVLMQLPMKLYDLFPVSLFLAMLLSLSILGGRQEIVVMRAAGLSVMGFFRLLFVASLLITVMVTLVAEGFGPKLYHQALVSRSHALQEAGAPIHQGGHWFHDTPYFVYVGSQPGPNALDDVQWFQLSGDQSLQEAGYAKHVLKQNGRWLASQSTVSHLDRDGVVETHRVNHNLPMTIDLSQWESDRHSAIGMDLWMLHKNITSRKHAGASYTRLAMAFWERLWAPAGAVVLALLAIPFSLGAMRRLKTSARLVAGVVIGFLFYMVNQLLAPFTVVLLWSPFWVNCIPTILFAWLGIYLLRRLD